MLHSRHTSILNADLLFLECRVIVSNPAPYSTVIGSTRMNKSIWRGNHTPSNHLRGRRKDLTNNVGKGRCSAGNEQHQLVTDGRRRRRCMHLYFPGQTGHHCIIAATWKCDASYSHAPSAFVLPRQIISSMSKGILLQEADTWMAAMAWPFYRHPSSILHPFQIISRFRFSRYIDFTIHLDVMYI